LPYWNRSQLSSSCDEADEEDDDDADADPVDPAAAADVATRARVVSIVPSLAPSAGRALSSDSSRCESGASVARAALPLVAGAGAVAGAVAADDAVADDDCGAGAERYGCSAASGTMMSRAASALMSVRPR
jgi:hypothetical protein